MCYNNNVERREIKNKRGNWNDYKRECSTVSKWVWNRKERTLKEANDFIDRVVSPKIEAQAKAGGHRIDITVAKGLDLSVVAKTIEDNGFSLMYGADPRDIVIGW